MFDVVDARPPLTEPLDGKYGTSTFVMRDGSAVCYSHAIPDELLTGLIGEWKASWEILNQPTNGGNTTMADDFYEEFEGERFRFEEEGDTLVGHFSDRRKENGRSGQVLVIKVTDQEGKEREVWCPRDLAQEFAQQKPALGDKLRIKLIELRNVGQPSPMKIFTLEVKRETPAQDEEPSDAPF